MEILEKELSTKRVIVYLIAISMISLGLKLYLVDFSSVPVQDSYGYILHTISITHGEFSEPPRKTLGWSIFASPFFLSVDSDNFIDYVNAMRILSIGVSTITIPIMYGLARKFFSTKYSLVASCLLAFEPHLNQIAGQGLSEPLYILALILSFYFVLDKKTSYLSFLFAGFAWWIRWPGLIMFFVVSLIHFLNNKKSSKLILQYIACIAIFLAIVSPMLIHRYEQYGDFMYFSLSSNIFSGDYGTLLAENTKSEEYTAGNYIETHGLPKFINDFILTGIVNIADQVFRMLFPYLIILIPFGILFSFRAFDQDSKHIRANWILILVTLCGSVLSFSLINERRFLFYLYPFLILFCTIPIQRLTKYGLSTLSCSERQKNLFLVGILIVILAMSVVFSQRYIQDKAAEDEKMAVAEFLLSKSDGKIILSNEDWRHGTFLKAKNPEFFKDFVIDYKENDSVNELIGTPFTTLYAKSLDDLLAAGRQYDLKYVVIIQNDIEPWYDYLNNVYKNESEYPYLIKIYDSSEQGLQKLHVKAFEIDYEKWASYKNIANQ